MAFKAGNKARKKESVQDTVEGVNLSSLEYRVGQYTRNIDKCCMDRLRAAVYYHRHPEKSKETYDDNQLEEEDEFKKISKEDIAKESLAILQTILQTKEYCFNPIIRKIFAGEITDFVAYPYPVDCGLKLMKDEKKLLIDINNFKCSFMEETMGNLYLSTKIILSDEKSYPDDINKLFEIKNEKIPEDDREKMSYKEIIGKTDRLGFYTTHSYKKSNKEEYVEPEAWLLINKIRAESNKNLPPYILAMVYIHEMMHRYFDMHPELPFKSYIKEIEEPMAELATIEFCREFCKKHEEYGELVNVAIRQTKGLKATDNYFYALGADLYELYDEEKRRSLIDIYRHVCMMLHEPDPDEEDEGEGHPKDKVKYYLELVRNSDNIDAYKKRDRSITKDFCDALIDC